MGAPTAITLLRLTVVPYLISETWRKDRSSSILLTTHDETRQIQLCHVARQAGLLIRLSFVVSTIPIRLLPK